MSIEFQNITKRFGDTTALDGISLTLEQHQIYGLLGNNGAGKTTLLSILADRQLPTEGQVLVDGADVRNNDDALGKLFLVGEQNLFPEDMRVRRAFQMASWFYPDFDLSRAMDLAKQFGLNPKKKINSLSTGYQSIFRLILGLCVNTPYVLFDEPVLGLDAQHRDLFYRLLVEQFAKGESTVAISTHLIAEVANLIGHAIILRDGRILKNAPTEELMAGLCNISGPAGLVDAYLEGRPVLSQTLLGGLKTVCVQDDDGTVLPAGLERSPQNLQDYFIGLMEEEDRK